MKKKTGDAGEARSIRAGWTVAATDATPDTAAEPNAHAKPTADTPEVGESSVDAHVATTASVPGGDQNDAADSPEVALSEAPKQMSAMLLVVLGIVGGLYIFYAWVTLTWVRAYSAAIEASVAGSGAIGAFFQQAMYWLSPLAAIAWFVAVLVLYRKKPIKLIVGLVLGLIILVPIPFLFSIGVAL
ncbi:hypothetical protein ICM05_06325 [Leucobacter sp. cx-42]|uniref:hypothetical protein n=1 Tax=unclassified Leucobacter TaxID=2621730 RepID=UPI00165D7336|nr:MULTISPECIES: hypothetical protein [unclassified Leucobacter]MBC9954264.1 hypothetical protein [Leucobacter sp. cx-42]